MKTLITLSFLFCYTTFAGQGSPGQGSYNQVPGKTLTVATSGGRFSTLSAAKTAAQSGDTILVYPGVYSVSGNLLKNGVNWYFFNGAIVNANMGNFVTAIFDDTPLGANGSVTSNITGDGQFNWNNNDADGSPPCGGVLCITNVNSLISFRAMSCVSSNVNDTGVTLIGVKNAQKVFVDCDYIRIADTADSFNTAVYWGAGEMHVKAKRIESGFGYVIWGQEPAAGTTANMYVDADFIFGANYACIVMEGVSTNWKTWVNVSGEIKATTTQGASLGTVSLVGGGKLYVTAQKISNVSGNSAPDNVPAVYSSAGELWITAEKVSANYQWMKVAGGSVVANVSQFEDVGTFMTNGILVTSGELTLTGERARSNAKTIDFRGGKATITGMELRSTNNVVAHAQASGLLLNGCLMISKSTSNALYSTSAFNVGVVGGMANTAKAASVTVQPGTLVVDANLQ